MVVGDINGKIESVKKGYKEDVTKGGRLLLALTEKCFFNFLYGYCHWWPKPFLGQGYNTHTHTTPSQLGNTT